MIVVVVGDAHTHSVPYLIKFGAPLGQCARERSIDWHNSHAPPDNNSYSRLGYCRINSPHEVECLPNTMATLSVYSPYCARSRSASRFHRLSVLPYRFKPSLWHSR